MAQDNFITRLITLIFVGILFLIAMITLKPIIISIILGLLMAYIFHPVYKVIYKRIKRENLSTFILIFFILIVIAIPLWYIVPALVQQIFDTYMLFQKINFAQILEKFLPSLFTQETSRVFAVNLNNIMSKLFSSLLNEFTKFIVALPNLLLQFAVFIFTFYFAVRDAEKLKQYVSKLSPFSPPTEEKFLGEFRQITNAIIYGQFFIGIIQGIALGIGLFILGVPKALTLTFIAIFASMIPVLGSWFVWLPAGILLIFTGSMLKGVILLIYGALFVSTIDNILRPYFLSKKSHLPVVIGLIGIIGGIYTFGIVGLILGPLILAYALIILDFYRQGKLNELFKK